MTIGNNVTVDVTTNNVAGNVWVGGKTVGVLKVDGGELKANNLFAGGVTGTGQQPQYVSGVTVTNGGKVDLSGRLTVGHANNYAGPFTRKDNTGTTRSLVTTMTIEAGAQVTVAKEVEVGRDSRGVLTIQGMGTTLSVGSTFWVGEVNKPKPGPNDPAFGKLELKDGASVTAHGNFSIEKSGHVVLRSGTTLDLMKGGRNDGLFQVETDGVLKAREQGKINAGVIKVAGLGGVGPGLASIEGDFTQVAPGVLEIDINGSAPGTGYDVLAVSPVDGQGGNVTLGGNLSVLATYAPATWKVNAGPGDYFTVITATGTLSGQFDPVTGLNLPNPNQLGTDLAPACGRGSGAGPGHRPGLRRSSRTTSPGRQRHPRCRLVARRGCQAIPGHDHDAEHVRQPGDVRPACHLHCRRGGQHGYADRHRHFLRRLQPARFGDVGCKWHRPVHHVGTGGGEPYHHGLLPGQSRFRDQ
jgi:hypothetical protein